MPFRPHKVDPNLLAFARSMRQEPAPAEQKLWRCLRNQQLNGYKFRRQVGFGKYIADFYCAECKLIVDLDGDSHSEREKYDEMRTSCLEEQGFAVVRFVNTDVFDHLESVLEAILRECEARAAGAPEGGPSPQPSPLSTGERG
jgi:very-short-patch-repair endonuclease